VDDQELVRGLRERREEAVAGFLERYRALFYHCIGHFEADPAAREDLFQDLVLFALERLDRDTFDPERGSFGTWLYRVAWCRCVDLKRKKNARRNPKLTPVGDRIPEQADERPSPSEVAGDEEIGGIVRRAMDTLEPQERELLNLRYVDGRTLGDISEALSISLEQAKYRLKRASVSLRKILLNQFALEAAE
jgi:RNA polymerase sigma-70 factor (ECF subfamily)